MAFQNWVEPYVFTSKKKKEKTKKKVDLKNNSKNASEKWPFIGYPSKVGICHVIPCIVSFRAILENCFTDLMFT